MPLVPAKCTNCGGILEVDNTKDAAICPYCGSAFIVEKAINYYNVSYNINHVDTVNIYGGNSADFDIRAGTLLRYNGASMDVKIPDNVVSIDYKAFEGCDNLRSISFPGSISTIPWIFRSFKNLTCVTISNGVKSIDGGAFSGCTALTAVAIPGSVTSIGADAFSGCSNLISITIPSGLRSIENSAFQGCSALTSVTIPNGVKSIGNSAFQGCSALTSVTIPGSVTRIGSYAFNGCDSLVFIRVPERCFYDKYSTFPPFCAVERI